MAQSAQIQKMSPRHEAILNYIIANPTKKYSEVAAHFMVTPAWLSTIVNSHAFRDQLARRQDEVFDSTVIADMKDKLQAAAHMTLDEYMDKVPNMTADQLISGGDKLLNRLGFGSNRGPQQTNIYGDVVQNQQNNHVSKDVLAEARERIGQVKVGEADIEAAVSSEKTEKGPEAEGLDVRAEGE